MVCRKQRLSIEQEGYLTEQEKELYVGRTPDEVLDLFNSVEEDIRSKQDRLEHEYEMIANKMSLEMFGFPCNVPLDISGRIKKAGGYLRYDWYNDINPDGSIGELKPIPTAISLSLYALITSRLLNDENLLLDIIRHEVIHYGLMVQGRGYKEDDEDFIQMVELWSAGFKVDFLNRYKHYQCGNKECAIDYHQLNKMQKGFKCGECGGDLHYQGELII